MTTYRRDLIKTIETILNDYLKSGYSYLGEEIPIELCEKIADAVIDFKKTDQPYGSSAMRYGLASDKVHRTESGKENE